MIEVKECPICSGNKFSSYSTCKDQTVSKKEFNIQKCDGCNFIITSPRPKDDELGQYYLSDEYISHTNKSKTLFDKVYQISRVYALKWKLSVLNKYTTSTKTLLDVGCGTGSFIKYCSNNHWDVIGVEPSANAKEHIPADLRMKVKSDLHHVEQKEFDAITLWHVLEHIPNLNDALNLIESKLKSTGTLFIAVPNPESWDAKKYATNWAAYDVPRHLWHFTQETMHKLMTKHHLQVVQTLPMKLDAYYVSLLSEKYEDKSKPVQFINGFINGLRSNMNAKKNTNYSSILYIIKKAK